MGLDHTSVNRCQVSLKGVDILTVSYSRKKSSQGQKMKTLDAHLTLRWENKQHGKRQEEKISSVTGQEILGSWAGWQCWASCPLASGELLWVRILTSGSFLWQTLAHVYKAAVGYSSCSATCLKFPQTGEEAEGGMLCPCSLHAFENTKHVILLFFSLSLLPIKNYGYSHFRDEVTENQRWNDPLAKRASAPSL